MRKQWPVLLLFIAAALPAHGQSLPALLTQTESNYPLLRAKQYEVIAAQSAVTSARHAALPSLEAAYQVNYATYNNITGMASSQYFVPISGPPSATNSSDAVFGSAASLLLSWDVLTFGQRSARTGIARAGKNVAEADAAYEVFRHKVNVVQTYLDLLLAQELSRVHQRNLDRSRERAKEIETLTVSGLRPGVDTALFQAELSRAKIELLNYHKYVETQKLLLAELLGVENLQVARDSSFFARLPAIPSDTASLRHPLISLSEARLTINKEQRRAVQRSLYPKLSLWGTTYARGSGIRYDGYSHSSDGLSFSRYNYGVGLQLSVPLLRFIDARSQLAQQTSLMSARQEQINQATLQLHNQSRIATLTLTNAIDVARENPTFHNAARFSYDALLTRYNAGIANYADFVQAQYSLLKAESDLKRSYVEAWKALLYLAATEGDLNIFLNQVEK